MIKNKGNIAFSILLFWSMILIFLTFLGVGLFQIVITGELHEIKNDLYLINRNVLMAIRHDLMAEDINSFYEKDVKKLVEEEIKRLWNIDVSCVLPDGKFVLVEVKEAKIVNENDVMFIESFLNIKLRPIIFREFLEDKLTFSTIERVKVEKMRGWRDE